MEIQIKKNWGEGVLFKHDCTDNTIKVTLEAGVKSGANLEGAKLRWADLSGAYLAGADLDKLKAYSESHDIFLELIRKCKVEEFTNDEWSIVGLLAIHRLCWNSIKKRFGERITPIFQKLADKGFDEFLNRYKGV